SALAVAALLFCGQALPALIVPALVARVEASRGRSELSALYAFEAIVTAALAIMFWNFSLPAVLVLVALDGSAALAASALLRAQVARTARDELDAAEVAPATEAEAAHAAASSAQPPTPVSGGAVLDERRHEAERSANAALNVAFSATFVAGPV